MQSESRKEVGTWRPLGLIQELLIQDGAAIEEHRITSPATPDAIHIIEIFASRLLEQQ